MGGGIGGSQGDDQGDRVVLRVAELHRFRQTDPAQGGVVDGVAGSGVGEGEARGDDDIGAVVDDRVDHGLCVVGGGGAGVFQEVPGQGNGRAPVGGGRIECDPVLGQ